MKRKNSLKRNEEIARIVKTRRQVRNNCFIIYFSRSGLDYSRICLSASKKLGNAVVRNKTKRQIREMLAGIFDLSKGVDYVIVVRNDYLNNSFVENKEKLENLYSKINL